MIGGLALQVASLFFFITLCLVFAQRVNQTGGGRATHLALKRSARFKGFLLGMFLRRTTQYARKLTTRPYHLSFGPSNNLHPHPLQFPRRRAERRLQWPAGERSGYLHGLRRCDGCSRCYQLDSFPSRLSDARRLVRGRFQGMLLWRTATGSAEASCWPGIVGDREVGRIP